jgi:hypothetical protein
MEENTPKMPLKPEPKPGFFQVWLYRIGCVLAFIALLCALGALSEIDTGPRESFIFSSFVAGTLFFGVPAAIAFLASALLGKLR